jgi:hypothetical protein
MSKSFDHIYLNFVEKHQLNQYQWKLLFMMIILHVGAVKGLLLLPFTKWQTIIFGK